LQAIAEEARALTRAIRDWFPVEGLPWVFEGSQGGEEAVVHVGNLAVRLDRRLYPLRLPFDATVYDELRLVNDGTPPEHFLDAQDVTKFQSRPFRGDHNATRYGFASFTGSPSSAIEYSKTSQALDQTPLTFYTALAAVMACHDRLLRHYQWGPRVAGPNKPWPCRWSNVPRVPQALVEALDRAACRLGTLAAAETARIDRFIAEKRLQTKETAALSTSPVPSGADRWPEEAPIGDRPAVYLLSWGEILGAVGLKNNEQNRHRVRDLNAQYGGPIIRPPQGGQPKANKDKLLRWWAGLEERFREAERKDIDTRASVKERHNYGRAGEVVPNIGGHVTKRRRPEKR
jgi:hypothetical protein